MKTYFPLCLLFAFLALSACSRVPARQNGSTAPLPATEATKPMAQAAQAFLQTLTPAQKEKTILPFDDKERYNWHYTPVARKGLTWEEMTDVQREAATGLLTTALSAQGLHKVREIMSLELVLRVLENRPADDRFRHPELYYLAVFGNPATPDPWGWRWEGHHVSLNYTSVGDSLAVSPSFFGANPAEVRVGPDKGKRVLAKEEDLGRKLLLSLEEGQFQQALVSADAPGDMITRNNRKAMLEKQEGLAYAAMTPEQQGYLRDLIQVYLDNMEARIAAEQKHRIDHQGWDKLYFAWAGGKERGQRHYYRIHGPTLLIEYDNTQNDANHIHSVWRDLQNDWGEDLLKKHYEEKHGH